MISAHTSTFTDLLARAASGTMVRTDSRQVAPGDVFVAMPGTRTDGSRFLSEALGRGAAFVVAPPGVELPSSTTAALITHPSPRQALGELALAFFGTDRLGLTVIGVTGTNGKTTVTAMAEHLLAAAGLVPGIMGTISCRWPGHERPSCMTTPDCWTIHETLAAMSGAGVRAVCMEVSSHALDQERIAGISFDAAVFTNLTQDHLDYHPSMEEYFASKRRLFSRKDGSRPLGIINIDDPYGARIAAEHRPLIALTMAQNGCAQGPVLRGTMLAVDRKGLILDLAFGNRSWHFASPLVGRHNAYNLMAAVGLGIGLELPDKAIQSMEGFSGVQGRLQRIENRKGLDIFVDYAHTPDALENVLSALRALNFKRIITVFGCGGDRDPGKRPLMGAAVARFSDVAVLTSDNPRTEDPEAIMDQIQPGLASCPMVVREADRRKAIAAALEEMRAGDALIVAGKGHEDYQIIGEQRTEFSDERTIREILG
jgi:UDP-N-acetylmuramoyl-L-alanyl-D-glutamate--2,6-diaminopimelate ligase